MAWSRLPALDLPQTGQVSDVMSLSPADLLPSRDDNYGKNEVESSCASFTPNQYTLQISLFYLKLSVSTSHTSTQEMFRKSEV